MALERTVDEADNQYSYCFGEQPSMADICLIPQIYNAHRFNCPMDDYPNLVRINENCLQLDSFRQAIPEKQADAS